MLNGHIDSNDDSPSDSGDIKRLLRLGVAYEKLQQVLDFELLQISTSKHSDYWICTESEETSDKLDFIRLQLAAIKDILYDMDHLFDMRE